MIGGLNALAELHDGIPVPEYGVRIPWLISEPELYRLIPEAAFAGPGDGWPSLRFTLLGITAVFGFNFVTHYKRRLLEVAFDSEDASSVERTFRDTAQVLHEQLETPNFVNMPGHLRWDDRRISVSNTLSKRDQASPGQAAISHHLSVFAIFGLPRNGEEATGINARIRDLFRALPGVWVDWVQAGRGGVRFGLAVSDQRTLSWLVHLACQLNIPVGVEIDWSCKIDHDDPACLRYDFRVSFDPESGEPDETMHHLEQCLSERVHRGKTPD